MSNFESQFLNFITRARPSTSYAACRAAPTLAGTPTGRTTLPPAAGTTRARCAAPATSRSRRGRPAG
eukprot:13425105-Alexandrium_andersonii.AAC.1